MMIYYFFKHLMAEMSTYTTMIIHHALRNPVSPPSKVAIARVARVKPANQYLISFSLYDHCLNFNAKSGISHTKR